MSQLNISGLISQIKERTSIYTPIVEATVNSIEAIEASGRRDGKIEIVFKRDESPMLEFADDKTPDIVSVEIHDNGIGFNQKNRDSFDTLYSSMKVSAGGKGFGRFLYYKYFSKVRITSVYKEEDQYYAREFDFGKQKEIIENEKVAVCENSPETGSTVFLNGMLEKNLEKKIDTIARKLVEKLLIYFIDDRYHCPSIVLIDDYENKSLLLNDYLKTHGEIQELVSKEFMLSNGKEDEKFQFKMFKIYYPDSQKSKISLVAHKREVTETPIHYYVPEFEENFFEECENKTRKDFMIKTYVMGKYLNNNVSLERASFNFSKKKSDMVFPFSQEDIEREAASQTREAYPDEINSRSKKKKQRIADYVMTSAPWHKSYFHELDLSSVPYSINDEGLELELQKMKFIREQDAKRQVEKVISDPSGNMSEKIDAIVKELTEIGKSDLAHYVCNRKVVLELLKKLLERNDDGSAKYEKEIHNVIFPMGKDSTEISYEDHNLWVLDERLVFSEFVASDKKISKKSAKTEPDLVIFNQKQSFRNGDNEFSNPLTIFEFKRPKRTGYKQEDDPILQICNYLEEIRAGKYEMPKGLEKIKVNNNTPVYGYVVCDIEDKIKEFARLHQLTLCPDGEGYIGYQSGYNIYIEVISYKKLLKDADLRNRIFFKKLGLI